MGPSTTPAEAWEGAGERGDGGRGTRHLLLPGLWGADFSKMDVRLPDAGPSPLSQLLISLLLHCAVA